ncbi:DUF4247 domain-containing protein [Aquibacillus koreensis]|uniref:DUF4247 domain-containing protein n=1 Tax=Aquibacillus koreensis TaxID=279446 RepID=A0A9X3WKX9_9BACI|nr:DUF4247 domain-containing protein [Aquibacillus koreensis]MCT2534977.1 DUF4247 domain-containing protein [Aquibacillus koreensis]MDC3419264.1 DUF4247 domain-containing protein [Aquibacillus koreensis]
MNKIFVSAIMLFLVMILAACGSEYEFSTTEEPNVTVQDIPQEPSKEELISQIESTNTNNIEPLIANSFHLLDVVKGEDSIANVYATNQFEVAELVSLLTKVIEPEQTSEVVDNQQILIYPNHFVTIRPSDEDAATTLIEVASDQFVRDNYEPNYLNTFFAFMILNRVLDVDDWGKKRSSSCKNGACYGGYSSSKSYNNGGFNTNRGMSSVRGGGPSSGK